MPFASHRGGRYLEDHRLSAPLSHVHREVTSDRKVHVLALAADESMLPDGREEALHRAVMENGGGRLRPKAQVDPHGMALARTNAQAVGAEGEALLVVLPDETLELGTIERGAVPFQSLQQSIHLHPACLVQRQSDRFGMVAENQAEELRSLFHVMELSVVRPPEAL